VSGKKNLSASVRQRLLDLSRQEGRSFNEVLQYYTMERFLYRLSQSAHARTFVLKGAMMLRVWGATEPRPTMDIDLLGRTANGEESVVSQFRSVLATEVEPDGLIFDAETLRAEKIKEDADYEGIRVRFAGLLDTARINLRIDIGFGDVVHPAPEETTLPTMLAFPAPVVLCYNRETVIAEKTEAMITLGELNSRVKDFYDVWLLSRQFDFDGSTLLQSLLGTFQKRKTDIPASLWPLFNALIDSKQMQWTAFHGRLQQRRVPDSFQELSNSIIEFLEPVVDAASSGSSFSKQWRAPGPWLDTRESRSAVEES